MADQHPEFSASEAEDAVEEETVKEEVVGEDTTNDGGPNTEEQEHLPKTPQGSWMKSKVKDKDLLALDKAGVVAARVESQWRMNFRVAELAPHATKILMIKSHIESSLSMPPSHFFSNLLQFYGLQLHHIPPNSLVVIAGYAALCEVYLGILPRVDLFHFFFCVQPNVEDDGSLCDCGTMYFVLRRKKEYPFVPPLDKAAPART
jgi:hypothetical protein